MAKSSITFVVLALAAVASVSALPTGFFRETKYLSPNNFPYITRFRFLPDGRLMVCTKDGNFYLANPGATPMTLTPFFSLPNVDNGELCHSFAYYAHENTCVAARKGQKVKVFFFRLLRLLLLGALCECVQACGPRTKTAVHCSCIYSVLTFLFDFTQAVKRDFSALFWIPTSL